MTTAVKGRDRVHGEAWTAPQSEYDSGRVNRRVGFAIVPSAEAAVRTAVGTHDSAEAVLDQSVDWVPARWLDDFHRTKSSCVE